MKSKIKVLIVDDSAIVRQSIASILQSDDMIEVMATASEICPKWMDSHSLKRSCRNIRFR